MTEQHVKALIHPDLLINANDRLHHIRKAQLTRDLVTIGRLQFGRKFRDVKERQHVLVTFCFPERDRAGRSQARKVRDAANWHPTVKALVDGITRAGTWPDDSDAWVEGPDVRIGPASPDPVRVEVWIMLRPSPARPAPAAGSTIRTKQESRARPMCAARIEADLEIEGRFVGKVSYFCMLEPHDPKIKHHAVTVEGTLDW